MRILFPLQLSSTTSSPSILNRTSTLSIIVLQQFHCTRSQCTSVYRTTPFASPSPTLLRTGESTLWVIMEAKYHLSPLLYNTRIVTLSCKWKPTYCHCWATCHNRFYKQELMVSYTYCTCNKPHSTVLYLFFQQ
jgi:hypothetical protein